MDNNQTIGRYMAQTVNMIRCHARKDAEKSGINMTELWIIRYLADNRNIETTQKDICDLLKMKAPTISITLTNLENEGLILRNKSLKDSRKTIITLTDDGINKSIECKEIFLRINKALEESISKDDLNTFYKVLESFQKVLEAL